GAAVAGAERAANGRWARRSAIGALASPRLGVAVGSRVVFHQIQTVPLGERDRRLGERRRSLVLIGVEVAPYGEWDAIDAFAAQRPCHTLAGIHSAANVVSVIASRPISVRTCASVNVASSSGRSFAYAEVVASAG